MASIIKKGICSLAVFIAASMPLAAYSGTDSASSKEAWFVEQEKSKMDDSQTVILAKRAENEIGTWLSKVRPGILIRCLEGKTQFYMVTESAAQPELGKYNKHTVEVRIDDRKPYRELWSQSTDSKSLFAPNALALTRELSRAKRLLIRFTPFNAQPTTAEFDVTGLAAVLPQLASACKWNP